MNAYTITFYRDHGDDVPLETRTVNVDTDVPFSDLDEGDQDSFEMVLTDARTQHNLGDDWTPSTIHNADGDVASVPDDMD
jgi:hypothetical protein